MKVIQINLKLIVFGLLVVLPVHICAMKSAEQIVYNLVKRGPPPFNLRIGQMTLPGLTISQSLRQTQKRTFTTYSNPVYKNKKNNWNDILLSAASIVTLSTVSFLIYFYNAQEFAKTLNWSNSNAIIESLHHLKSVYPLLTVSNVTSIMRTLHVDPNQKDYQTGKTLLHCLVRILDNDTVFGARVLLELGADIKVVDKEKLLPSDYLEVVYHKTCNAMNLLYGFTDPDDLWSKRLASQDKSRVTRTDKLFDKTYQTLKNLLNPVQKPATV